MPRVRVPGSELGRQRGPGDRDRARRKCGSNPIPGSKSPANGLAFEDEADGMDRQNLLYAKGPLVLHAIGREFAQLKGGAEQGDPHLFNFLRARVRDFTFKPAETSVLPAILQRMTATDWQPSFENFLYGTEMPPLD